MITGFVFHVLPGLLYRLEALVRESALFQLLQWLWREFTGSLIFRTVQAVYRRVRGLCYESLIGHILARHRHEGRIYEGSFIAFLFDGLMDGLTWLLRKITGLLTFGTYDSVLLSLGRRALARLPWLDFEFVSGGLILLMLLCPSQLWHNVYALGMGAALFALLIALAAIQNRPALRLRTVGLPLIAFAFSCAVGVGIAADRSEGVRVFCFFLAAFLFCAALAGGLTEQRKLKKLLAFLYIGVVAAAAVAIAQRFIGVSVDPVLTDLATNQGMPGRVYSVYENPNNYAEIIVLLLPVAAVWTTMLTEKYQRLYAMAGLALPVAALLMTYSRSSWIGFALAVIVFLFFCGKRVLPAFFLLALLAVPLLPQTIWNRILTIGSTADTSNMYRIQIWSSVMDMLRERGLIGVGLGPDNFQPVFQQYASGAVASAAHSHMVYLEVWAEMGLLGIGSYLIYCITTVRKAVAHFTQAPRAARLALIAGVSSLAGIAFVSAAEYIWYYPRVLFCFFILTGVMAACTSMTDACDQSAATGQNKRKDGRNDEAI